MPLHTKVVGERTEARVLAALVERYPVVLLPWGENHRFDLGVVDDDGVFFRVQCKTGRLRNGAIQFNTSSFSYHHPANRRREELRVEHYATDYRGDADLFGVYCPDTREVFLVPVEDVGTNGCYLRTEPPRNGQKARIRWAADYRIDGPDVTPE